MALIQVFLVILLPLIRPTRGAHHLTLRRLFEILGDSNIQLVRTNPRRYYEHFTEDIAMPPGLKFKIMREAPTTDQKKINQWELQNDESALNQKPYVEEGEHKDFLVIGGEGSAEFKNIIPNDFYFNIEKKCVNWLDNCTGKGLQTKLLNKIRGPGYYRR